MRAQIALLQLAVERPLRFRKRGLLSSFRTMHPEPSGSMLSLDCILEYLSLGDIHTLRVQLDSSRLQSCSD